MMKSYVYRPTTVQAEQVTVENVERLAALCGGTVKGMQLPPEQRVIDIWDKETDGEIRAEVGDYVVRRTNGTFRVSRKAVFEREWVEIP